MSSLNSGTIDSAARGNAESMRTVLNAIHAQFLAIAQGTGIQLLEPTSGGKPQTPVIQPPPQAALTVTGANGLYNIMIANPSQTIAATIYHEVSYSSSSNYANAISLPLTPSTSFPISMPGTTLYWRIRSSYDQQHFNAYRPAQGNAAVSAGLQSSDATSNNVPLNQSNYATLDSQDNGAGSANVRVYGTGGPGFMYPSVKGSAESILPSATIVNVPFSSNPVIAYDGEQYAVKSTLPQVFADNMTPTGSVSVVGAGGVMLPTVSLVLDANGHIVAWNVLTQGSGLTAPVTLHINPTTGGSGATPGAQTISGGKLISISPGNPGSNYNSADTVSVSGGTFGGASGGGRAIGGNGGRLVYNDTTTN